MADVVVCGAGIAGVATAWWLAERCGVENVKLAEAGAPLSLTSDKSTECYRNWWPDAATTAFANRSIDLMEALARETDNRFLLDRRGYLFATARDCEMQALHAAALRSQAAGAGTLRVHEGRDAHYATADGDGFEGQPDGADLLVGEALVQRHFPYVAPETRAVLHTRRCGGLSAQQLGMLLLERARERGVELVRGRVCALDVAGDTLRAVHVETHDGIRRIDTHRFVNCAGPYAADVAALGGDSLPLVCEKHVKLTFDDVRGVVPRGAPLLLWNDPLTLPWTVDEAEALRDAPDLAHLLDPYPAGVHARPLGRGETLAIYWTHDAYIESPPVYPVEAPPHTAEILLRAMSVMLPGLDTYFAHLPKPWLDGGHYAKTPDNRPLVGASGPEGVFLNCGWSGYGIMSALAGAELAAAHALGRNLPPYAATFAPVRRFEANAASGQM